MRDDIENELDETELDKGHQDEMQIELQTEDLGLVDEEKYQEKNLRVQTKNLDLVVEIDEDSDSNDSNESFVVDEDDDHYSDYNDDDDDNNDDNDDDDSENEEDIMQIDRTDDEPSKKMIEGLRLLHIKSLYNFTESAYDDIMKTFTTENVSLYKVKKYLKNITNLRPEFYDMCENSCICYTGVYELYTECPICKVPRLDARGKPKKVMPYLSIKDRLKMQFNNENRAKELLYRYEYTTEKNDDDYDDIFDGEIYKELVERGLFSDKRDIAFTASCDGYQIFKQKTDDCWLFLIINNNIDPSLRVKKENLLVPFLIPGPKQPKDFNSFLRPFINEMLELESKCHLFN